MPQEGFVAFIEHSYRDPSEPSYRGSISGTGITLRQGDHDDVTYYGYRGAFKKGKHYVAVREDEDTSSEAGRQSHSDVDFAGLGVAPNAIYFPARSAEELPDPSRRAHPRSATGCGVASNPNGETERQRLHTKHQASPGA
jgi:hypothetical protein